MRKALSLFIPSAAARDLPFPNVAPVCAAFDRCARPDTLPVAVDCLRCGTYTVRAGWRPLGFTLLACDGCARTSALCGRPPRACTADEALRLAISSAWRGLRIWDGRVREYPLVECGAGSACAAPRPPDVNGRSLVADPNVDRDRYLGFFGLAHDRSAARGVFAVAD